MHADDWAKGEHDPAHAERVGRVGHHVARYLLEPFSAGRIGGPRFRCYGAEAKRHASRISMPKAPWDRAHSTRASRSSSARIVETCVVIVAVLSRSSFLALRRYRST